MQKGALSAAWARLGAPEQGHRGGAVRAERSCGPRISGSQTAAASSPRTATGGSPITPGPRLRRPVPVSEGGAARQGRHMRVPVTPDAPFGAIIPGRHQLREGHGIRSQWAPRAGATGFWAGSGAQVRAAGLRRSRAFRRGRSECRVGPARRFSGSCSLTADVGFPQQHRGLADRVRGVWGLSPRRTYLSPRE